MTSSLLTHAVPSIGIRLFSAASSLALLCACPPIEVSNDAGVDLEAEALLSVKAVIEDDLEKLHAAAVAIHDAAPAADADGWSETTDADAVTNMKSGWKEARIAYERVEGAIAVLFPELDASTDERYDGFLEEGADDNLFDGDGVTGVHGIERILWSDSIPQHVADFEEALTGYTAAEFPQTQTESDDFKSKLLQRLVDDTQTMVDDFKPLALDNAAAYRGVMASMEEQLEKIDLASTGEDESRYAQHTLADMRANLAGGRAIFEAFEDLIVSKDRGQDIYDEAIAAFDRVKAKYEGLRGDALPAVPATWNSDAPSADDLSSDYGSLWEALNKEADFDDVESLVSKMSAGADLLDIPQL